MVRLISGFCLALWTTLSFAQTFNGTTGTIQDNGNPTEFTVNVNGLSPSAINTSGFGLDKICFSITHPWVSDLDIQLIAPDNTIIDLVMGHGGNGDNFTNTCLSDNYSTAILSASAPFTGNYRAQGGLGDINNGQNGNGTWKLRITDNYNPDQGTLVNWALTFSNTPSSISSNLTSSNLPIIVINTGAQSISDDPKIMADMGIIYNGPGLRNYITDPYNEYNGKIGIEIRGSSSSGFPKKSYGFETWDINGTEIDSSLLGMPIEHDWALIANYTDKSLMNNMLSYKLFRDMGRYAPRTQYVELVINNQYQGVYMLTEKIKRDKNRVSVTKMLPTDIAGDAVTGGYIFKVDKTTGSGGGGWTSNYVSSNGSSSIYFQYEYPNDVDILPQQSDYIKKYVDSFETALKAPDFDDPLTGYRKYISEPSLIKYFILNELSRNVDGYRLSTYLYKDRNSKGGKLRIGPPWDYDIAWHNADYCDGSSITGWAYEFANVCPGDGFQIPFWWKRLLEDPVFANNLKCEYESLRNGLLSVSRLHTIVDSVANVLNEAQARNFNKWPILGQYVWPNPSPIPTTYQGEVDELKQWISDRLAWLDANMPGTCPNLGVAYSSYLQSNLSVYPNPTEGNLHIHFFAPTPDTRIELLNSQGITVSRFENTSIRQGVNEWDLDLSQYIPQEGIYLLRITAGQASATTKIVNGR